MDMTRRLNDGDFNETSGFLILESRWIIDLLESVELKEKETKE